MTQDMNRLLANNPQLQNVMSNPEARLVMVEQLTKQFEDMFVTITTDEIDQVKNMVEKPPLSCFKDRNPF